MAFDHAPLTEAQLGPMVTKMVGAAAPPQMRRMVAGGMAPLPPRDLVIGLYQLWVLNEDPFAEQAARTAEALPRPIFDGAVADASLLPGIIDFLARKVIRKAELLDQLVRHPQVSDETIIGVARVCPDMVCDTLADNQERWLRCPKIAESLYRNPNAKMSVVHRMLELAEREHLDLRLPGMEEIRSVMRGESVDPSRDGLFRRAVRGQGEELDEQVDKLAAARVDEDLDELLEGAADGEEVGEGVDAGDGDLALVAATESAGPAEQSSDDHASEQLPPTEIDDELAANDAAPAAEAEAEVEVDPVAEAASMAASRENRLSQLLQMRPLEKIRAALLGDQFDRSILVRDSNKMVAMATIKSPKIRDDEIVGYSANRSLSHDVIRYIANRRDWVRLYQVKFNLVMNPKTPMSRAMALLAHLHATDVRKVARSKNISSALAKAAKRRGEARR